MATLYLLWLPGQRARGVLLTTNYLLPLLWLPYVLTDLAGEGEGVAALDRRSELDKGCVLLGQRVHLGYD